MQQVIARDRRDQVPELIIGVRNGRAEIEIHVQVATERGVARAGGHRFLVQDGGRGKGDVRAGLVELDGSGRRAVGSVEIGERGLAVDAAPAASWPKDAEIVNNYAFGPPPSAAAPSVT